MKTHKHDWLVPIGFMVALLVLGGINAAHPVLGAAPAGRLRPAGRSAAVNGGAVAFNMVVSGGAAACVPYATADLTVTPTGPVEVMDVNVSGLPADSTFNLFVIQVPTAPFGVAWYEGDIETDDYGQGSGEFAGRFSIETFAVAPGSAPAPFVHNGPFPDATVNPSFNPIHAYHLGLWFDSPDVAAAAGCPATVTPFSGDHTAGIQVLNTRNFPDDQGPLRQIQ